MHYEVRELNGLKVLFAPMEEGNSVTVQVLVKAGSIYETVKTNGLSHFLEHLFFKGGKKYPTPHSVAQAVDAFGGEFNAFTGDEIAGYYVKAAPEHVHKAIDVLADMLLNPLFPKEELEREKGVVIQEMKMYEDMPQKMVAQHWKKYFYGDNPFGRPIIGTKENVLSFTQEDLFRHKQELYAKDSLLIIVAGRIVDQKALESDLVEHFGGLSDHASRHRPASPHTLPVEHSAYTDAKTQQNHIIISAKGFAYSDERRYAASVLAVLLGGNMSSRLFQNIREKLGVCYYIGASHSSDLDDGLFLIRAGIDKEKFDFAVSKIGEEIQTLITKGVTELEFQNAIGYLTGQLQMGIESSDQMADFLGEQLLLQGHILTLDHILKQYHNLTLHDITQVFDALEKEKLYQYHIQ